MERIWPSLATFGNPAREHANGLAPLRVRDVPARLRVREVPAPRSFSTSTIFSAARNRTKVVPEIDRNGRERFPSGFIRGEGAA
jgi:hypothetical protein